MTQEKPIRDVVECLDKLARLGVHQQLQLTVGRLDTAEEFNEMVSFRTEYKAAREIERLRKLVADHPVPDAQAIIAATLVAVITAVLDVSIPYENTTYDAERAILALDPQAILLSMEGK